MKVRRLRCREIDGKWYIQEKKWFFWMCISKGFRTKRRALSYKKDLDALVKITRILDSYLS